MDHEHCRISSSSISCGVLEISSITDNLYAVLYNMASRLYHPSRGDPAAFFIWSGLSVGNSYLLAEAIKEHFPKSIVGVSEEVENPKTSNIIKVWIWTIPHEEFKKWYKEEKIKRIRKG